MDDWISHYFWAFWAALIVIGAVVGSIFLTAPYGPAGGIAAGAIGGAGAALIISASRYIGSNNHEDQGPRS